MSELEHVIAEELARPVDQRVTDMAAAVAASFQGSARAVLFYGSCLREQQLDGLMLDFYLIVDDYRAAYGKRWLATANRLLPPNVFPFTFNGLSAKYAVLSEADFARECSPLAGSVSVFARFAQPARLVWVHDDAARALAVASVAAAVTTLLRLTRAAMTDEEAADPLAVWGIAFTHTYGAELRAERSSRPAALVEADPERYARLADAAGLAGWSGVGPRTRKAARRRWRRLQPKGQAALGPAPHEGQLHLRQRHRLSRVEDQSPRRHRDHPQAVAAALAAARGDYSAASLVGSGGNPLNLRDRVCATACASAVTVNGLRNMS